jgi:hypothetical protein
VHVNIVGFALEEARLATTFKLWAEQGAGAFFEARDAAGLERALALALRPAFDVLDANKRVVASGFAGDAPVQVMAGDYTVALKIAGGTSKPVTIQPGSVTAVTF